MSKVTSKYQVTLPRHIARAHRIEPGSEIEFESTGDVIRIHTGGRPGGTAGSVQEALESFDAATTRQEARREEILGRLGAGASGEDRGWSRDDLYAERIGR